MRSPVCRDHCLTLPSLVLFFSPVGLTASSFGLGATLSNFIGQLLVENFGHVVSLSASLWLSLVPIALFAVFMPETLGHRGENTLVHRVPAQDKDAMDATSYKAIV